MKNEEGEFYDNILNIFNTKGKHKNSWELFIYDINSNNENINRNIISKLYNCIWENQDLELALVIIDFIIEYGSDSLINEIASDFFLHNYIYILSPKYECNQENKKLAIVLLKKWSDKKKDFINFEKYYNRLVIDMKQSETIIFPPSICNIKIYLKYISEDEINEFYNNFKNDINIPKREKTVYQNPFLENIENKNNNKIDNIHDKKNYFNYINQSEAPPQLLQNIINNQINDNNMNPDNPDIKDSIKIYDSNFLNNINGNNINPDNPNNK